MHKFPGTSIHTGVVSKTGLDFRNRGVIHLQLLKGKKSSYVFNQTLTTTNDQIWHARPNFLPKNSLMKHFLQDFDNLLLLLSVLRFPGY